MIIIEFLQAAASPGLDAFAQGVSDLGSAEAYIAVLVVIYLGIDTRLGQRAGTYLLFAVILNAYLKGWIATDRPFVEAPELNRSTESDLGHAFPSGHSQGAATLWGYLAVKSNSTGFRVLAGVLIGLVALSRLYLGVHWPIDVLGGLLIGAGIVLIALELDRRLPALDRAVGMPIVLKLAIAIVLPLTLAVVAPPPGAEASLMLGGFAAYLTTPLVFRFRAGGAWWRRALLVGLGLALVFAVLAGTSVALPEAVKRNAAVGFVRYLALGWTGLIVAPWLGGLLRIAPRGSLRLARPPRARGEAR